MILWGDAFFSYWLKVMKGPQVGQLRFISASYAGCLCESFKSLPSEKGFFSFMSLYFSISLTLTAENVSLNMTIFSWNVKHSDFEPTQYLNIYLQENTQHSTRHSSWVWDYFTHKCQPNIQFVVLFTAVNVTAGVKTHKGLKVYVRYCTLKFQCVVFWGI